MQPVFLLERDIARFLSLLIVRLSDILSAIALFNGSLGWMLQPFRRVGWWNWFTHWLQFDQVLTTWALTTCQQQETLQDPQLFTFPRGALSWCYVDAFIHCERALCLSPSIRISIRRLLFTKAPSIRPANCHLMISGEFDKFTSYAILRPFCWESTDMVGILGIVWRVQLPQTVAVENQPKVWTSRAFNLASRGKGIGQKALSSMQPWTSRPLKCSHPGLFSRNLIK